jgi:hypothetical protein
MDLAQDSHEGLIQLCIGKGTSDEKHFFRHDESFNAKDQST